MRASLRGIWFLVESRAAPGNFSIVRTNLKGRVDQIIDMEAGTSPTGLTATAAGVATVLVKGRSALLTEYSDGGAITFERAVKCFGAEFLVSIRGMPSTICADGTVQEHNRNAIAFQTTSWARPGSIVAVLATGALAVIDRATGQTVLSDLKSGNVVTVGDLGPDIEQTVQKTRKVIDEAASRRLPGQLGKLIVVMDAAADDTGWYTLIWPYHPRDGISVTRFANSGKLDARFQLLGPFDDSSSLHQIEVLRGYLIIASVGGTIYKYKL